jgi:hypothetical protein
MPLTRADGCRNASLGGPAAGGRHSHDLPHLSVVAVSRNDDHGGALRGRMQHFVSGFIAQCRKHQLNAELLLVEWNPPPERRPLEAALEWPTDFGPAIVRVVSVPPRLHATLPNSDALPLFQMIGKNVGIRRARGRYVLATNIDILFDDAIVLFLRDRLKPGIMVRTDRYDVPGDLATNVPFDRVLAECRRRFFQVHTRFGPFDVRRRGIVGQHERLAGRLLDLYCEVRIFGWSDPFTRAAWRLRRSVADRSHLFLSHSRDVLVRASQTALRALRSLASGVRHDLPKLWPLNTLPSRAYWRIRRALRSGHRLWREINRISRKIAWFLKLTIVPQSPAQRRLARMQHLHTNGCGDFTLLARDDWFRLRGYPEWPIFSWHLDSIFMFAASAHGVLEVALNSRYRIYHIDHSKGSGWSPDGAAQLFARLDRSGIPYISDHGVERKRREFSDTPSSAIVNDADWGLADFDLPEREIIPSSIAKNNVETGPPRFSPLESCQASERVELSS